MKKLINIKFLFLAPALLLLGSCKKKDALLPAAEMETKDYVYNVALKGFQPEAEIKGTLKANFDVKTVYYYLQRANRTDSLLQTDLVEAAKQTHSYAFEIKEEAWRAVDFKGVKAVKVLFVNSNSISVEKFIKLEYFDPAAPVISELPETLTPSLTAPVTINGKVSSQTGISKIEISDNNSGSFEVIETITVSGEKQYTINYPYTYADGAGQLRIVVTDIYGLQAEKIIQFIGIPFKPVITFSSTQLKAALPDGVPVVDGVLKTYSQISELKIYVVKANGEMLLGNVGFTETGSAPNEYNYSFTYPNFPFADDVTACRIEAKDGTGSVSSNSVSVKILPYYLWKNVTMMAQGVFNGDPVITPTNSFFIGEQNKPVVGSCDVAASNAYDKKIDFMAYATSTPNQPRFTFYNPKNSVNIRSNYRCDPAVGWAPVEADIKDNKIRVLLTTSNGAGNGVYNKYNAGGIEDLSDAFFTGTTVPSGNTAYCDGITAPSSSIFDPATAYLIWMKTDNATKNILIRVRDVDIYLPPVQGKSTVVADIYKQR